MTIREFSEMPTEDMQRYERVMRRMQSKGIKSTDHMGIIIDLEREIEQYREKIERGVDISTEMPPLGVKPYYIAAAERIGDLAAAIRRQAEAQIDIASMKEWAAEITAQLELMERME